MEQTKEWYMNEAIKEAKKAELIDEVPIGAVLVYNHKIIARSHNLREKKQQSTAHAEILAIEKACKKVGSWRLEDCDLYVTLEPCPMCAGAILQSRIRTIYFGAADPKGGSTGSCFNLYEIKGFNHYPQVVGGVLSDECSNLLKNFFQKKRDEKRRKVSVGED